MLSCQAFVHSFFVLSLFRLTLLFDLALAYFAFQPITFKRRLTHALHRLKITSTFFFLFFFFVLFP
jgi:hypothetical protein